ncbi:unnamed protein product [Euphydryas editha]|uniref:Uncharacterized protein n=1 Tax=Euphydryas editha TaxID=104508 RepID=A0AAU9V1C5_EUPED|nr:unnamed protein product [Euphydryas editha]
MWDEDDDGTNNYETNFGEDDLNMEMTGFDGSTTSNASVLSKPSRSAVKKHVQFPDEQSCIEEATEAPNGDEKPGNTSCSA